MYDLIFTYVPRAISVKLICTFFFLPSVSGKTNQRFVLQIEIEPSWILFLEYPCHLKCARYKFSVPFLGLLFRD